MIPCAELEIGLEHIQGPTYKVRLRFQDPNNAAMATPVEGTFTLDRHELRDLELEPTAYGVELARQLFAHAEVRAAYDQARATAFAQDGAKMRLQIFIGPTAQVLQALRWELLVDPASEPPVAFADNERTPFSRFMVSADSRPIRLRPKARLKAIVAVSAPSDLADYPELAQVPLEGEVARALEALQGIETDIIGDDESLTLAELLSRLRQQEVDILYLVCHGAIVDQVPHLFFQQDDGKGAWENGEELARGLLYCRGHRAWRCSPPARAAAPRTARTPPARPPPNRLWRRAWPRPECRR